MTDMIFSAVAAFDRKFFWEGGNSVRYLVARLRARRNDDRRPAERRPLNIALVIDASGSMGGGKLEAAKSAAIGVAERLTERDRLTVVSFASDVQVHLDAVTVTRDNARRIRSEIRQLTTRGRTSLSHGWFAGVECAARVAEADPRMTPRVILLSDGHANAGIVDPQELGEHAGELRLRGVLTSTLGIGDGYDEQLLRSIAENGGGRLHDAELDTEISSVLLGELDDIYETAVEDARIALTIPTGMRTEILGTSTAMARGGRVDVSLGPLQTGADRTAVFKITCPKAGHEEVFEFELSATGRATDDGTILEAETATATLMAVDGRTNTSQIRDTEIAGLVARTWSAHVVAMAARMNRDGAFQEAQDYLKRELLHFQRYVQGIPRGREMLRELQILSERVGQQFSSRMHKEMVLQASLATQGRVDRRGAGKANWSARMHRGD